MKPARGDDGRAVHPSSRLALAAILILAVALRLPGLATVPFWTDELHTIGLARGSLSGLLAATNTVHPPGYPLLAWIALRLGRAEWCVRVPALVAGILTIPVIFRLARALGCPRIALAASLLVACSAYHVYYSQEARGYSCLVLFVALGLTAAVRFVGEASVAALAMSLASCLLAVLFHYMAAPAVAVVGLALLVASARHLGDAVSRRTSGGIALVWGLLLASVLAAGFLLRGRLGTLSGVAMIDATTRVRVDHRLLAEVLGRWSGLGAGWGTVLLALVAMGAASSLLLARRPALLLLVAASSPFALFACRRWPMQFESRYLLAGYVPALILVVLGGQALVRWTVIPVERWTGRSMHGALGVVVLALVTLVQLSATLRHDWSPRKYMPPLEADSFGQRFVVFGSRLDPWLVETVSASDYAVRPRRLGPIECPLPDWELVPGAPAETGWVCFTLRDAQAEDILVLMVGGVEDHGDPRASGGREPPAPPSRVVESRIRYQRSIDGDVCGVIRLDGRMDRPGVVLQASLRTSRLGLGTNLLQTIAKELRCDPVFPGLSGPTR